MLVTNQRFDKLAAARVDFVNRGMLDPENPQHPSIVSANVHGGENRNEEGDEDKDKQPGLGPTGNVQEVAMVTGNVTLAQSCSKSVYSLANCFIDDAWACSTLLSSISGGTRWTH